MFFKKTKKTNVVINKVPPIVAYKNKYRKTAEELYQYLGKPDNYSHIYNCMTRLRITIKDKKQVNIDAIKQLNLIKDTHWNGNELQIIIGGEVIKVADEFKKYQVEALIVKKDNNNEQLHIQQKKSLGNHLLSALTGIMGPIIPILMIIGFASALQVILTQIGLLQSSVTIDGTKINIDMSNLSLFNLPSGIFYILSKVLLNMIGIFFIFNTVKYFNGNPIFALAIGVTLAARGLFATNGIALTDAHFGTWVTNCGKTGWLLFTIGNFPITIGGYEGSIIPYIIAGIVITYLDKWIKEWMPMTIDIIFRPALVYLITMFGLWFLLAPIFDLLEYGISQTVQWIGAIKFGFGLMIFAFLWQILVLTGVHIAIVVTITMSMLPSNGGQPSYLYAGMLIAAWAQIGAVIGVAIRTKNAKLRNIALSAIPAGIFGITEPIIYAVNLPKIRPYLFGCTGAGIAGFVSYHLVLTLQEAGGQGIFGMLMFSGGTKVIPLILLTWTIGMIVAFVLTMVFYNERVNEQKLSQKAVNKLALIIFGKPTKAQKNKVKVATEKELNMIKKMKKKYLKLEQYYSKILQLERQLASLEEKENKNRDFMYKKLLKLQTKLTKTTNENIVNKFNILNDKYSNYNFDDKKTIIQKKILAFIKNNETFIEKITNEQTQLLASFEKVIDNYYQEYNKENILQVKNIFFNAIKSVEIGFSLEKKKQVTFIKK